MLAPGDRSACLADPGVLAHTLLERFCQYAPPTELAKPINTLRGAVEVHYDLPL